MQVSIELTQFRDYTHTKFLDIAAISGILSNFMYKCAAECKDVNEGKKHHTGYMFLSHLGRCSLYWWLNK